VKALVLATLLGGAGGLWLARKPDPLAQRDAWIGEARAALTGDLQTADLDRALAAVGHVLDVAYDPEAQDIQAQLLRQKRCRQLYDAGEHALANHDVEEARLKFARVGPGCKLYDFAFMRLEQIGP
jgi:hypothetical protein